MHTQMGVCTISYHFQGSNIYARWYFNVHNKQKPGHKPDKTDYRRICSNDYRICNSMPYRHIFKTYAGNYFFYRRLLYISGKSSQKIFVAVEYFYIFTEEQ